MNTANQGFDTVDPTPLNPYASPPAQYQPTSAEDLVLPEGKHRLFTVVAIRRLPIGDLFAMTRNVVEFVLAVVFFKILRFHNRPVWACAFLDSQQIDVSQIPPKMRADLESLKATAESLGFVDPLYFTSPMIGPKMMAELCMITPDGRIEFSCTRTVTREGKVLLDEVFQFFASRLTGDRMLVTSIRRPQVRPPSWQLVQRVRTHNLSKLLDRHRQRLAEHASQPISLSDRVEDGLAQERRVVVDMIRRGILREATADEIYAIETRL